MLIAPKFKANLKPKSDTPSIMTARAGAMYYPQRLPSAERRDNSSKVDTMQLKFSHVDILVKDLEECCAYYAKVLNAKISRTLFWERGDLRVRYAIVMLGTERFMLVQPISGNLKLLMETHGEGTIYRHCYSTPDIEAAYDELVAAGVQPENENGEPLARENLQSPSGTRIIWLPKRFGHFSIELLEEAALEQFIKDAFAESA